MAREDSVHDMNNMRNVERRGAWLLFILVLALHAARGAANAAAGNCDPGLQPAGAVEIAYAERGDRCEGVYAQEVAGGTLEIASLTVDSANYKFSREVPLLLRWPAIDAAEVQLRASGLRRKLYYRMDARRSAQPPTYRWPSEVLARLDLSRDEIGLLAWTERNVGRAKRRVYIPIDMTPATALASRSASEKPAYKVVLLASVELQEVYVTLRSVAPDGRLGKPIRADSALDQGFYPAERPIAFEIPYSELGGASTGLFMLSIGAELKNGEPRSAPEMILYHPQSSSARAGGRP